MEVCLLQRKVAVVSDENVVQGEPNWEKRVIEKLALESIVEQRRGRRWGIFFKLLGFGYLLIVLGIAMDWWGSEKMAEAARHTALVRLEGVIQPKGDASAENIISALQAAYASDGTAGVVLRINSPGGSPVQAGMIFDEIKRFDQSSALYRRAFELDPNSGKVFLAYGGHFHLQKKFDEAEVWYRKAWESGFGFMADLNIRRLDEDRKAAATAP